MAEPEMCDIEWVFADAEWDPHLCELPLNHDGDHRCQCGSEVPYDHS